MRTRMVETIIQAVSPLLGTGAAAAAAAASCAQAGVAAKARAASVPAPPPRLSIPFLLPPLILRETSLFSLLRTSPACPRPRERRVRRGGAGECRLWGGRDS